MIIRNGMAALETGLTRQDIRITGEIITERGDDLIPAPDEEIIDASGLWILPGFIDSHVHFRDPGHNQKEDFLSGTRSALAGGVTTVLDMPNTNPPTDSREHLEAKSALVSTKAVVDYGLYFGATDTNSDEAAVVANDVAALKLYMGSSTGSLLVTEFSPLYHHFSTFPHHKPLVIHAEDEQALKYFGAQGSQKHNQARPPISAQIALSRALAIAEKTSRRLHIAHTTTERELELIHEARNKGVPVTCEVTPLHLFLNEEDQERLGNLGKVNPPLRSRSDQEALWQHLDLIDTIATDHAPHTLADKDQPYEKAPSGMPGVQTMLPLLLTAVQNGKCTIQDIVKRCVSNPVRIFGLKTKGTLEPGKDADIILFDPAQTYTLTNAQIYSRCGWTPFDGTEIRGKIHQVWLRGQRAYDQGTFLTQPGSGKPLTYTTTQ